MVVVGKLDSMEKLPTVEEFLNSEEYYSVSSDYDTQQAMIEFAKMHVEAALQNVWNKSQLWQNGFDNEIRVIDDDEELFLNSYPLTNIK